MYVIRKRCDVMNNNYRDCSSHIMSFKMADVEGGEDGYTHCLRYLEHAHISKIMHWKTEFSEMCNGLNLSYRSLNNTSGPITS